MPYKQRECTRCEASYIPNSNSQKYCKECAPKAYKEGNKRYRQDNPGKVKAIYAQVYQEKKEQDIACLYSILNKMTDRGYIGETVGFERRVYEHKKNLQGGRHPNSLIQKDYDKYGADAFEFSMVKEINKEDFQSEKELKECLKVEEAMLVLEEVEEGKELYNLALNLPITSIPAVLRGRETFR